MNTLRRNAAARPRRSVILSQDLFRDVVLKERNRADRANHSVVLVLVSANDRLRASAPAAWVPVIEALTDVASDTDLVGWFEWRAVIGVILPQPSSFHADAAHALEERIRQEIARLSEPEHAGGFAIHLHIHPEDREALDFPELHPDDRLTVNRAIKRAFDVIGSSMLLLALLPLLLAIAALAKLRSPGPVFYKQVRVGERMKPFTMLKFRTMHVDADHRLHQEYVTQFINAGAASGPDQFFKITNDPRVTPIGRFLRKTSLDELPQLWNVLRGDMSLVGPRPPIAYELEQYKPWHYRRVFEAKPGITGLWQVTGRSRTTFDQMVRLDLRYARSCSMWTDIKILLATPRAVISGKGAC
jgi:exopolysaccharide biosynthesis polyprenyl glycosylphosphotransferase